MASSSDPAPSSRITTPAVACGTNTDNRPSPPVARSATKRRQAAVKSAKPRSPPVRTWILMDSTGQSGTGQCSPQVKAELREAIALRKDGPEGVADPAQAAARGRRLVAQRLVVGQGRGSPQQQPDRGRG